jgi:hypothetical protein
MVHGSSLYVYYGYKITEEEFNKKLDELDPEFNKTIPVLHQLKPLTFNYLKHNGFDVTLTKQHPNKQEYQYLIAQKFDKIKSKLKYEDYDDIDNGKNTDKIMFLLRYNNSFGPLELSSEELNKYVDLGENKPDPEYIARESNTEIKECKWFIYNVQY